MENIETIGLLGFVFTATALAATAYERRMDVLHGPYIRGRTERRVGLSVFLKPAQSAVDRLRWKARGMIYVASIIAC
jgi:hypothetical protein